MRCFLKREKRALLQALALKDNITITNPSIQSIKPSINGVKYVT